jgi:hypothetical protein
LIIEGLPDSQNTLPNLNELPIHLERLILPAHHIYSSVISFLPRTLRLLKVHIIIFWCKTENETLRSSTTIDWPPILKSLETSKFYLAKKESSQIESFNIINWDLLESDLFKTFPRSTIKHLNIQVNSFVLSNKSRPPINRPSYDSQNLVLSLDYLAGPHLKTLWCEYFDFGKFQNGQLPQSLKTLKIFPVQKNTKSDLEQIFSLPHLTDLSVGVRHDATSLPFNYLFKNIRELNLSLAHWNDISKDTFAQCIHLTRLSVSCHTQRVDKTDKYLLPPNLTHLTWLTNQDTLALDATKMMLLETFRFQFDFDIPNFKLLASLPRLRFLYLSCMNYFTLTQEMPLPASLKEFIIHGIGVRDDYAQLLPRCLEKLHIYPNKLAPRLTVAFLKDLPTFLLHLDLRQAHEFDLGSSIRSFRYLPRQLKYLYMSTNDNDDEGSFFADLPRQLIELSLPNKKYISDEFIQDLPPYLMILRLDEFQAKEAVVDKIKAHLKNLKILTTNPTIF